MKTFILLFLSAMMSFGGVFTSSQSGLWSSSATWGGSGPPTDGDTAVIGAHTVIVSANTTVGTSPNDNTSNVVSMTSASSVLIISNSAVFTVKGNIGHVNGGTHRQLENTTVTFDNSGSGGSPVYRFQNGGFSTFHLGSNAVLQAIAGQTIALTAPWGGFSATNSIVRRASSILPGGNVSGSVNFFGVTFDTCDEVRPTTSSTTINFIVDHCTFTNGTDSTEDFNLTMSAATTTGIRRICGNLFFKQATYNAKSFDIQTNCFMSGMAMIAGSTWSHFRNNYFQHTGILNGGNGALFPGSMERNYFAISNTAGNSHFIAPTALLGADNIVSQNVFEFHGPDASDMGDCVIINSGSTSSTNKVVGRNNIVLPCSYTNNVSSGTMLTVFSSASTSEWYHCTANVNDSWLGGTVTNGMFSVAESTTGVAGQVGAIKGNLAWGSSANQGWFVVRQTGNVKDIITAANADYNWRYNSKDGDNQRGYEDKAAGNTLWTAGDAVAASVDSNQGSGNPQFYDSNRNLASWAVARGYGTTFTNAVTSIQSNPSRVVDLIAYVFEGFRPGNASIRNAAHDGGAAGAANYYKSGRSTNAVYTHRAGLVRFGI